MKKFFLSVVLIFVMGSVVNAQDTVCYGDPWYAFEPLPALVNRPFSDGNLSSVGECVISDGSSARQYIGYTNNDYTIFGIAILLDTFPGPEWNMALTLLRGMDYHTFPANPNTGMVYDSVSGMWLRPYTVHIDSLYSEDTLVAWSDALMKQCFFEFPCEYDAVTGTYKGNVVNCYEFYFDTPIKTMENGSIQLGDTFFVGQLLCNPAGFTSDPVTHRRIYPLTCASSNHDVALHLVYSYDVATGEICQTATRYDRSSTAMWGGYSNWGGMFPIVGLRCSVPQGLMLSVDSLTALWTADGDAVQYELAVCHDTVPPDYGQVFSTFDTYQSLPPFSPDSVYRVYLRKLCYFGTNNSVWSDWSDPLVIGNQPNPPDPREGIGSVVGPAFGVSPNPVGDLLVLQHQATEGTVTVDDLQGHILLSVPASQHTIDVSQLPQGVYVVTLSTPNGSTSQRVVKQ